MRLYDCVSPLFSSRSCNTSGLNLETILTVKRYVPYEGLTGRAHMSWGNPFSPSTAPRLAFSSCHLPLLVCWIRQQIQSFDCSEIERRDPRRAFPNAAWTLSTNAPSPSWHSVSLSSTGQYQTAVVNAGGIWTSSDHGATFRISSTSTANWQSVSVSSTGQYQTAVISFGDIFTSSNYGETWINATNASNFWQSLSVSS